MCEIVAATCLHARRANTNRMRVFYVTKLDVTQHRFGAAAEEKWGLKDVTDEVLKELAAEKADATQENLKELLRRKNYKCIGDRKTFQQYPLFDPWNDAYWGMSRYWMAEDKKDLHDALTARLEAAGLLKKRGV